MNLFFIRLHLEYTISRIKYRTRRLCLNIFYFIRKNIWTLKKYKFRTFDKPKFKVGQKVKYILRDADNGKFYYTKPRTVCLITKNEDYNSFVYNFVESSASPATENNLIDANKKKLFWNLR